MAGVPATLRPCLQRSNPLPRICPTQEAFTDKQIKRRPSLSTEPFVLFDAWQFPTLAWETPHYHRRYGVSLLSSAWGQVGPPLRPPGKFCFIRPLLRSDLICIRLKIFSHPPKHLRRCKVKPHGSLVPVSSTHRCAYTRPINVVVFNVPSGLSRSQGELISGQVSCLDAFSTYLPHLAGSAIGMTTRTPVMRPLGPLVPGAAPQFSSAHGR